MGVFLDLYVREDPPRQEAHDVGELSFDDTGLAFVGHFFKESGEGPSVIQTFWGKAWESLLDVDGDNRYGRISAENVRLLMAQARVARSVRHGETADFDDITRFVQTCDELEAKGYTLVLKVH